MRFKKNFLGRDLYHGGVYPWKKMNCYKTTKGRVENRLMDEHIVLDCGTTIEMKSDSLHYDFKSLGHFIDKHNWYSSRETIDYFENSENTYKTKVNTKTWIKMNLYYKLPSGARSFIYYVFRYYIKMGFLDGREGKIYAFLQAYWYRYLVDAKIFECKKLGVRYRADGSVKKLGTES